MLDLRRIDRKTVAQVFDFLLNLRDNGIAFGIALTDGFNHIGNPFPDLGKLIRSETACCAGRRADSQT